MNKVLIGLLTVMALCAFAASSEAADEWLVEEAPVEAELATETEGLLVFVKYDGVESFKILSEIDCNVIIDGTIMGGKDRLTAVLNTKKEPTGTLSAEDTEKTPISCEVTFDEGAATDCKAGTMALIWLVGINLQLNIYAPSQITLVAETKFFDTINGTDQFGKPVGFDIECETLFGIKGSEECIEQAIVPELTNDPTTVPISVLNNIKIAAAGSRANCTLTGARSGDVKGELHTWATEGAVRLVTEVS